MADFYFFHGAPHIPLVNSGDMNYFFHSAPHIVPIMSLVQGTQNLQMRARIQATSTKTIDIKAAILAPTTIDMRARILRQQGWPIPGTEDEGINGFTDTSLRMLARIQGPTLSDQALTMKAKIRLGGLYELTARARIVTAASLQMKARITGVGSSRITMEYDVSKAEQIRRRMVFYVAGNSATQTLRTQAFIVKRRTSRITGRYLVTSGDNNQTINTFVVSFESNALQTLRIGAGIVR
jgi:hypothetical protein